jgi:Zn-dependent oligopeptidase
VQPERVKLTQRLSQSRPLYEAFKQIREGPTWESLSEAQKRVVEGELRDFVLGGVALEVSSFLAPSPSYNDLPLGQGLTIFWL